MLENLTGIRSCSLEWSLLSSHREWCSLTASLEEGKTTQKTSTVSPISASFHFCPTFIHERHENFSIQLFLKHFCCCSLWSYHQDRPDCRRHCVPLDMGRHTAAEFQPGLQERSLRPLLVSLSLLSLITLEQCNRLEAFITVCPSFITSLAFQIQID